MLCRHVPSYRKYLLMYYSTSYHNDILIVYDVLDIYFFLINYILNFTNNICTKVVFNKIDNSSC